MSLMTGDSDVPLANVFQLLRIIHQNLHTKLHACLLEVDVKACNLRSSDTLLHRLDRMTTLRQSPSYDGAEQTYLDLPQYNSRHNLSQIVTPVHSFRVPSTRSRPSQDT